MPPEIRKEELDNGRNAMVLSVKPQSVFVGGIADANGEEFEIGGSVCDNGCCADISFFIIAAGLGVACKLNLEDAELAAAHILSECSRLRGEKA